MAITAVIGAAVITAGATYYSVDESRKANDIATTRANVAAKKQDDLLASQQAEQAKVEKQGEAQQRKVDSRTLYAQKRSSGAGSSIKTSPLGITTPQATGGGKQLLGS